MISRNVSPSIPLGTVLREIRLSRRLSLKALEEAITAMNLYTDNGKPLRLTDSALSRIEAGERMPSYKALIAIASALDIRMTIVNGSTVVSWEEGR